MLLRGPATKRCIPFFSLGFFTPRGKENKWKFKVNTHCYRSPPWQKIFQASRQFNLGKTVANAFRTFRWLYPTWLGRISFSFLSRISSGSFEVYTVALTNLSPETWLVFGVIWNLVSFQCYLKPGWFSVLSETWLVCSVIWSKPHIATHW